jgi:histidinol-phosphatase (PHP family)
MDNVIQSWRRNYHTHSNFCDGANTLEEMVQEALIKGFETLGFSGHAYTPFDTSYCMNHESFEQYCREVSRLRMAYKGQIQILLGLEYDCYSDEDCKQLDYRIGSVHYVLKNDKYLPVDESPEHTKATIAEFGGDPMAYAEAYFDTVAQIVEHTNCDIIGHFDLIKKFNRDGKVLIDENHPRYIAAWKKAIRALVETGKPFEINTSPLAWRTDGQCYPSDEILREIRACNGKITISSDTHKKEHLDRGFDLALKKVKRLGFDSLVAMSENGPVELKIVELPRDTVI